MKRLISLVLILCMACMLIPATAEESAVGTWYIFEMDADGIHLVNPDLASVIYMVIDLKEDGTGSVSTSYYGEDPEVEEITWKQDGSTITLTAEAEGETEDTVLTLENGVLTMADEEMTARFTTEKPAETAPAEPVAAESEEAFFGSWSLAAIEAEDTYVPKSLFEAAGVGGLNMLLKIEAGKAVLTIITAKDAEPTVAELATALEDGMLALSNEEGPIVSLQLLSDGTFSFPFYADETAMTAYMALDAE